MNKLILRHRNNIYGSRQIVKGHTWFVFQFAYDL